MRLPHSPIRFNPAPILQLQTKRFSNAGRRRIQSVFFRETATRCTLVGWRTYHFQLFSRERSK